jgi:quinol-cytochrome oxidoreductase complex cytochrome b subunit
MFYFVPEQRVAYANIQQIKGAVAFGNLVRNMHRWSAHLMVVSVTLHMIRVFYHGAYKPPREFNWVIGVTLFLLTLLLSFTGYLLPWDQIGFWAITVGSNMASYAPLLGAQVHNVLTGQPVGVGGPTLIRFYTLHVIGLPLAAAVLMAVHFWRIRKDGGEAGPPPPSRRELEAARADRGAPVGSLN